MIKMEWTYSLAANGEKTKAMVTLTDNDRVYRAAAIRQTQREAIEAAGVKLNRIIKRK